MGGLGGSVFYKPSLKLCTSPSLSQHLGRAGRGGGGVKVTRGSTSNSSASSFPARRSAGLPDRSSNIHRQAPVGASWLDSAKHRQPWTWTPPRTANPSHPHHHCATAGLTSSIAAITAQSDEATIVNLATNFPSCRGSGGRKTLGAPQQHPTPIQPSPSTAVISIRDAERDNLLPPPACFGGGLRSLSDCVPLLRQSKHWALFFFSLLSSLVEIFSQRCNCFHLRRRSWQHRPCHCSRASPTCRRRFPRRCGSP